MLSILSIGTNASPPPRQTQPTASDEPSKSTEGSSSSYAKQSASSVGTGTKETAAAESAKKSASVVLTKVEDKKIVNEELERKTAEQRVETARFRAMIDDIAPVANSSGRASKSYISALLTPQTSDAMSASENASTQTKTQTSKLTALSS
ncbi:MAG: hypothetical protein CMN10_17245 [Roseobacter sp.]|jgi:hypothetical protein|nr:hypothetical protein [Roseobacter sp.]MBV50292.1 hypothetical protein [Roseobacter sp.]|tara:strand:- start:19875 stop:20324 length:450 start_codon:yes stop_codon:yes gene_type:complete